MRLLVGQLRDQAPDSSGLQRDRDTAERDIDALDQQPQDARLLGGIELVPYRLESAPRGPER